MKRILALLVLLVAFVLLFALTLISWPVFLIAIAAAIAVIGLFLACVWAVDVLKRPSGLPPIPSIPPTPKAPRFCGLPECDHETCDYFAKNP